LLFERLTGLTPLGITLVAIIATINGVVIEIIMASRVVYGMAKKGRLPAVFAQVNAKTQVPLNATLVVTGTMLAAALFVPLDALVSWTSQVILSAFILVNLSLFIIKVRGDVAPKDIFIVPLFCPIIGAITCAALLVGAWLLT